MKRIEIFRVGTELPEQFAGQELRNYLSRSTEIPIVIIPRARYIPSDSGIWVGALSALGIKDSGRRQDDTIGIKTKPDQYRIAGSSPRNVLLAAYRFLTELGFRWVRPGSDGVVVPSLEFPLRQRMNLRETASYRHRCVTLEGASGLRHVLDMIDWLPKMGFNSYFVQFRTPDHFFRRWYHHEFNSTIRKEPFDARDAAVYTRRIWAACRKRGLILQMVGHGWTCDPLGLPARGWRKGPRPISPAVRRHLAKVNGRRGFQDGIPLNTNLCYGNPACRHLIAQSVADYAADHPHVDVIHLWLADGCNNHCECRRCRDQRPADLYLKLLNETDALLTQRNLPARIVFLLYFDLLWPPLIEQLDHPDRFILMLAPVTRTYTRSLAHAAEGSHHLPPFLRNRLPFPKSPEENLCFYRAWRQTFKGDGFLFDYHLMWDHFKDPGHHALAKVLHADIRALRHLDLNGLNSVQVQRCFLPSGLLMTVMGRTLWNRRLSFDEIADDHYRASFGPDWPKVKRYLRNLSELFDPPFLRKERTADQRNDVRNKLTQLPTVIKDFLPVIEAHRRFPDRCRAQSWYYLREHAELSLAMAKAVRVAAESGAAGDCTAVREVIDLARRKERRLHRVFDLRTFVWTIGTTLGLKESELNH